MTLVELSRLRLQKNPNYKYLAIFDPLITNRLLNAKGIGKYIFDYCRVIDYSKVIDSLEKIHNAIMLSLKEH